MDYTRTTGGNNFMALVVGLLCLAVSVLIYAQFVIASSKASLKSSKEQEQIGA